MGHLTDEDDEGGIGKQLASDLLLGTAIAAVVKTSTAWRNNLKWVSPKFEGDAAATSGFLGLWKERNLSLLWRGNFGNCMRFAPHQGIVLAVNDGLRNVAAAKYDPREDFWRSLGVKGCCGAVAGACAVTACYPFVYSHLRRGTGGTFDTLRQYGITGLYRHWHVTAVAAAVYRGGQLGFFHQIQEMEVNPYSKDKGVVGIVSSLGAVIVARSLALLFCYPFDTVRRRMFLQAEMKNPSERIYTSAWDCLIKLLRQQGLKGGLYRGLAGDLFHGFTGSVVVVVYDRLKFVYGL